MNIVVVDGYTLNPGDLTWKAIESLGDLQVYERSSNNEVIERCKDAEVILTNKVPFTRETLDKLPKLKMIGVLATGFNIVDTEAAKEKGIAVCNVPDYSSSSVTQHTFAFILEFATQVGKHSASVHNGEWAACKDFSYSLTPLMEISGKTLGLVGLGNIGKKVAEVGRAFGMEILYHTPSAKDISYANYASLEDLFSKSDFVSLHLPLKADNKAFVNKKLLSLMKPSAFIVNTSRGALINEADLASALNSGQIAGAGIDVLSVEPPSPDNPLLTAKNCFITPHNAWMSFEARKRILEITRNNITGYLNNFLVNIVNP